MRCLYFVNHQNLCRVTLLSDGAWAPITTAMLLVVYFSKSQKECCRASYAMLFVKRNTLPTERNSRFNDYFQVPCFWKVFHGERDHWVCWLHIAVWLAVALGVGDLYTKEYRRQMET